MKLHVHTMQCHNCIISLHKVHHEESYQSPREAKINHNYLTTDAEMPTLPIKPIRNYDYRKSSIDVTMVLLPIR